jgi:histidine ammonia-lyase
VELNSSNDNPLSISTRSGGNFRASTSADLRGPEGLDEGSRRVYAAIRKVSPFVDFDREVR